MLEASSHVYNSFVTLTYAPENLPPGESLVPRHAQLWQKRFRKDFGNGIRFFTIGEYGDLSGRPHYHAAVFGAQPLATELARSWPLGLVHVGELTPDSAAYLSGYVTKKMTRADDPRLAGRHPEFSRPSRRPGLGVAALMRIAEALTSQYGSMQVALESDVPLAIKIGGRDFPLGRFLRERLRELVGGDRLQVQQAKDKRYEALQERVLQTLCLPPEAYSDTLNTWALAAHKSKQEAFQEKIKRNRRLSAIRAKSRLSISNSRKKL